jgi:hypothetical protein
MLAPGLRDQAGTRYADLVGEASAERGEPWRSAFEPGELTAIASAAGFGSVRHVRQRNAIPGGLWDRRDALTPAALPVLFHGTVAGG